MKLLCRCLVLLVLTVTAGCQHAVISADRLGVCSWSWQKDIPQVAFEMENAGVKGVHLALGPFIAPDERHGAAEGIESLNLVKEKLRKGEWKLFSTMVDFVGQDYTTLESIKVTGGIVPDHNWEANKKLVTAGARLTQELGCKYMSGHAGFLDESNPKAYRKYVERVRWIRDECRKYGVEFILESGQETAEDLAAFMPKVDGVGINFDPANMILYAKGRPMDALEVLYPWIRQVHIKDARLTEVEGTWGTETAWGLGEVGGKDFIDRLEELGYRGNYVIEREGGSNRVADIRRAVREILK